MDKKFLVNFTFFYIVILYFIPSVFSYTIQLYNNDEEEKEYENITEGCHS